MDLAYKEEELFRSQKARTHWLSEGDKNTHFFHAKVVQRRHCNRIESLEAEGGGICETEQSIEKEISEYYQELFTSADFGG